MEAQKLVAELKRANLLAEEDAQKLLRESSLSGKPLEDILYERRLVDGVRLAQLKSAVLGIPYQRIDFERYDDKLLELIPEETVRTYLVAPLAKDENTLVVGMVHPDDPKAQEALKFLGRRKGVNLGIYLLSYADWREILKKYSPYTAAIQEALQALNLKPGEGGRRFVELEETTKGITEEAPVIRLVADTIRQAVETKASDIHIEPQREYLRIRTRLDGELKEIAALPLELAGPIASRVKVMSKLKIDETRVPQDGRFSARVFEHQVDFRVATFPTTVGEKVAIRVLDPQTGLRKLEDLNLAAPNLKKIRTGLEKPYGLILVTGPTGSGKTTSIYAMLQELNKESVNIVTLEDPVEYFISGLNQSQVRPEIGYDFAAGLRQILRQDPDVISVGEIRDNETAALAIHAALTGHVVVSTLHTNDSVGAIPRLIDMGIEGFLIPAALNLVTAQRLVPVLCQSCKQAEDAPPPVEEIIKEELSKLPKEAAASYKPPYKIFHSPGCAKCKGRGVSGRMAIVEVVEMTKELGELVVGGHPSHEEITQVIRAQGMVSMRGDGIVKALAGLVSMEEVIRETKAL
jgi:type IV pilus assembly protein PilB